VGRGALIFCGRPGCDRLYRALNAHQGLQKHPATIARRPISAIGHRRAMTSVVEYSLQLLMVAYDLSSLHRIQKATLWGSGLNDI
jgi:hypothetical protein